MKKKLAILGASYLQKPLIEKAKTLGIETHVFAWKNGAVASELADFYYPISILDKEEILEICKKIEPDGITSIASDIAMPAVNYIASKLELIGNTVESTVLSTDKYKMREALQKANIPCPRFSLYEKSNFSNEENFNFPLIVKPTDRSGSRGVTKVHNFKETNIAIIKALENSFNKRAIVEEFINSDREFSVEFVSFKGNHYPLTITRKITTGSPFFTEIEHHQPADLSESLREMIFQITKKILDALAIRNGASHTEIYLLDNNEVKVVECAGRMGGDFIGSHIVQLSTGFDFLHATIDVALGCFNYDKYLKNEFKPYSGVYYIVPKPGIINSVIDNSSKFSDIVHSEFLMEIGDTVSEVIDGSDKRAGIIVYSSDVPQPIKDANEVLKIETI